MSNFLHDSQDACCKTPFGAAATDEVVHFRVFLPISYHCCDPCLLMYKADWWDCEERPMHHDSSDGVIIGV